MLPFGSLVRKIQRWWKRRRRRPFNLDVQTLQELEAFAKQQKSTPEEIADVLIDYAVRDYAQENFNSQVWINLSPREQQVLALVCLGYTTRQIAAKMGIGEHTVKKYVKHILIGFRVPNRHSLRILLYEWNFNGWDI